MESCKAPKPWCNTRSASTHTCHTAPMRAGHAECYVDGLSACLALQGSLGCSMGITIIIGWTHLIFKLVVLNFVFTITCVCTIFGAQRTSSTAIFTSLYSITYHMCCIECHRRLHVHASSMSRLPPYLSPSIPSPTRVAFSPHLVGGEMRRWYTQQRTVPRTPKYAVSWTAQCCL